jgi:hypothetical protein
MSNKFITAPTIHDESIVSDKKAITSTDVYTSATTFNRGLDVYMVGGGSYLNKFDWVSYGYDEPTTTTERYRFYSAADQGGSVLATFTFTYEDSSKSTPPNGSWS